MRRLFPIVCLALLIASGALHCYAQSQREVVFQVSPLQALLRGAYDGPTTVGELKKYGDFGLGTVNGLDGEMVVLDGNFYQVTSDGLVHVLPDAAQTPFVVLAFFRKGTREPLGHVKDYKQLKGALDAMLPAKAAFHAVRIDGSFNHIKVRSVPRQHQPYPPLKKALEGQTVFDLKNVMGTMVGFRFPGYMSKVNVPGYHFHFLSSDRKSGGHVLDCSTGNATVEYVGRSDLWLRVPTPLSGQPIADRGPMEGHP